MPTRGERAGLGLTVADDRRDDQVGVVERGPEGVRQGVPQFAAFVDAAGRLRRDVTRNAAGEAELLEQPLQPDFVLRDMRVDFAVGAFEVGVRHKRRPAVPGAGDEKHVQVLIHNDAVQVDVDEVQAGRRAPVPEQPGFDVLTPQRFFQERVVEQVDLADRQVVGRSPVRVHRVEQFGREFFG